MARIVPKLGNKLTSSPIVSPPSFKGPTDSNNVFRAWFQKYHNLRYLPKFLCSVKNIFRCGKNKSYKIIFIMRLKLITTDSANKNIFYVIPKISQIYHKMIPKFRNHGFERSSGSGLKIIRMPSNLVVILLGSMLIDSQVLGQFLPFLEKVTFLWHRDVTGVTLVVGLWKSLQ